MCQAEHGRYAVIEMHSRLANRAIADLALLQPAPKPANNPRRRDANGILAQVQIQELGLRQEWMKRFLQ